MSAAIHNLLDQAKGFPGLLAAGVFAEGQHMVSKVVDPTIAESELDKIWKHLSDAMEVSQHHRMPATQMRWIYERVLVYCLRGSNGLRLGLIFSREAAPQLNQELFETLFNDFMTLRDV